MIEIDLTGIVAMIRAAVFVLIVMGLMGLIILFGLLLTFIAEHLTKRIMMLMEQWRSACG